MKRFLIFSLIFLLFKSSYGEGIDSVVKANNRFSFDIYRKISSSNKNKNIFLSPYSIFSALAITYEGAKGKTADEIKSVFHFPEKDVLRANFSKIYRNLNKKKKLYILHTVNALWIQKDYGCLKGYIDVVRNYYGGEIKGVDFINETEKTRRLINDFIEDKTNKKIKDLIPKGALNPLTRLVITNAIYFKGLWKWEFDRKKTRKMKFYMSRKDYVEVPMMCMEPEKARFNYADLDRLEILELPYKGKDISMLILLPKKSIEEVESILTIEKFEEWKSKMRPTKFDEIYLPKFEIEEKYSLKNILSEMGMPTSFSPSADFSAITGKKELFISDVIHQAYVKVDEKGTEAAGATAVVINVTGVFTKKKIFKADHPFIFIIQEKNTGNILFVGKIFKPA